MNDTNQDDYKLGSKKVWEDIWTHLEPSRGKFYSEGVEKSRAKYWTWLNNRFIEKGLPPGGGLKLLECGCGRANTSLYFAKRGYEAYLLDSSVTILNVARENFSSENIQANIVTGDVLKLPFQSCQFDVVISAGLLEHFEDVTSVVAEMTRVLKPGGLFRAAILPARFCIQTPFDWIINKPVGLVAGLVRAILKRQFGKIRTRVSNPEWIWRPPFFENSYSKEQYMEFLRAAGLEDVWITGINPLPMINIFDSCVLLDRMSVQFAKISLAIRRFFLRRDPWITSPSLARGWYAFGKKKLEPS